MYTNCDLLYNVKYASVVGRNHVTVQVQPTLRVRHIKFVHSWMSVKAACTLAYHHDRSP